MPLALNRTLCRQAGLTVHASLLSQVPMDVTPLSPPSDEEIDATPALSAAEDTGLDEMEMRLAQLAGLVRLRLLLDCS